MYPQRFWLAVGSGEFLNEHITGEDWPPKTEREERLKECVAIMRALWAGDEVQHAGLVRVERAKLYTRPQQPPMLLAAALTADTAQWAASWAESRVLLIGFRRILSATRDSLPSPGPR
jgi:alkanesulfonate monooxygenase SsuD/methylene tetrahydromethanopterin reductase-like flavin-dependent oxidoreductase (luciferase family)